MVIATALGVVGYSSVCWGYFSKNDLTTKWMIVLGCVANGSMYAILGMYISLGVAALAGIRTIASIYYRNTAIGVAFLMLNASLPLWLPNQSWITALPGMTGVIAMYWLSGINMKLMLILTSLIWMAINLEAQNWVAVGGESLMVVLGLAGILRLRRALPAA